MRKPHGAATAFLALICAALCLSSAVAQGTKATSGPHDIAPADDLDAPGVEEVTMEAHKLKLGRLRQAINKSVDNFYDAFNKANTVPGYETTCSDEKPPGTVIQYHICRPKFVHDATEDETQGFFYGYSPVPATNLILIRMPGYKKRIRELIHTDPNVRQAALEFDALNQRYNAVSKEKVKAH